MARSLEADVASPLAEGLRRCSRICQDALEDYAGDEETTGKRFFGSVVLAAAAMERVANAKADDPMREASLMIAATVAHEAADTVRAHGLDPQLLRCAEACDRAAALCEQALSP